MRVVVKLGPPKKVPTGPVLKSLLVKIAKALHIQPNFPYSVMGEVLQTRLKIYDLSLVPESKLYVCVTGGQVQILWEDLACYRGESVTSAFS